VLRGGPQGGGYLGKQTTTVKRRPLGKEERQNHAGLIKGLCHVSGIESKEDGTSGGECLKGLRKKRPWAWLVIGWIPGTSHQK